MCYQPPGTDICITFKSPLMRGCFRWYQSHRLAVGCDPRIETSFVKPFRIRTFSCLTLFSPKHSLLILALFQMADNRWSGGICHAEPGLPKLLLLDLECVGVVDTLEYIYREYDSRAPYSAT